MIPARKRFENPLQQYGQILYKRRRAVIVCFLGALAVTYVYNLSLAPLYRSSSRILIEDPSRWLGLKDSERLTMDWYLTQFEILKSKPIVAKVVQKLDLARHYTPHPQPLETLRSRLTGRPPELQAAAHPDDLVPTIQRSIGIDPQTSTGLVSVSVVATSPRLARDIANAVVETFIEENVQAKMKMSFAATEYLQKQLQRISENLREAHKGVEDFEASEGIQGFEGQPPLDMQQFNDFLTKYIEARGQRWELEERLKVLERAVASSDFTGVASPLLASSRLEEHSRALFDAQIRLDKLRQQGLLDKHPDVIQTQGEIDTLRKRLVFETRSYMNGLRGDLAALEQRERSLADVIQQSQKDVSGATRLQAQYQYLKREVELQKGFYDHYDQQLKELKLTEELQPTTIRVIEMAEEPGLPFSPNKRLNLGIGLITGLFLGVFFAFFREYLDDTIKSAEDVQEYLEMPVLGTIPVIGESQERGVLVARKLDSSSFVVESYRTLRTNLQFFESERPLQSLLFTSTGPAEGKSTTVANTALTLVQMGKRVCIVDTDLRRPILHKIYNKPNRLGVTSLFAGSSDWRPLLVSCGFESLYLLPCGPIPPNPAELLASARMEELVQALRKEFDYILFDSPPVLAVTDALVLSSLVDAVLLVVKSGEARIATTQMALDSLVSIKANLIGVILNHFNYQQSGYYRNYSKYYRYGYGYGAPTRPAEAAPTAKKRRS